MSQGNEVFNLARTTYLRLIPYLSPAAVVGLGTTLGALALGPAGIIPGALTGAVAGMTSSSIIRTLIAAFTVALVAINNDPNLFHFVTAAINRLRNYLEDMTGNPHGGRNENPFGNDRRLGY